MKYEDDELAEAAVLLASVEANEVMPSELKRRILENAPSDARREPAPAGLSTTKGAAIEVDAPVLPFRPRPARASVREWAGWIAAAAVVALAVFHLRSRAVERAQPRLAASSEATTELVGAAGRRVAAVRVVGNELHITVTDLPVTNAGESYWVWMAVENEASPKLVGSFACSQSCTGETFRVSDATSARTIWMTRSAQASWEPATIVGTATRIGQ